MSRQIVLGDYVELVRGTTYKGSLVGAPGPALLGLGSIVPGGGFRNDFKTYGGDCPPGLMLGPGDLYVSLKGATKDGDMIGSVARVPTYVSSGRLTQDTVRLKFRQRDPSTERYIYWLLRTSHYRDYCAGRATGSAVVALSRADFLSYPVPPVDQRRGLVINVLERLDDKIESNRRAAALTDGLARTVFAYWRATVDTETLTSFGASADVFGGATPQTGVPEYWGGDVAWATPTDVTTLPTPYLFDTARKITRLGLASCAATLHPPGTIFMTSRATIGAFCLNEVPAASNQGFIAVRPKREKDRWFLFEEMRSRVPEFLDNANGSTFLELSRGRFKQLPLARPSEPAIERLATQLEPIHAKASQLTTESSRLAELRDALLPLLWSGRTRAGLCSPDIDHILELEHA